MKKTLEQLAKQIGATVQGDPHCEIMSVATVQAAQPGQLSFLANSKYRHYLETTKASAMILTAEDAALFSGNALIVEDPYYAYAQVVRDFAEKIALVPGIHASAVVGKACRIDPTAQIDANVVIGDNVSVGPHTHLYPGVVIGEGSIIGEACCLYPNVTLYRKVRLGDRVILHGGVVLGSDGFGFAHHNHQWSKVQQIGHVELGDDVEIGANTTVDCGAIENTVIGNGVKLDNQIQVGHNVHIGDHTIIAGCVGIAGSATIGKYCMIGGNAMIGGHLTITDGVVLTGGTGVMNSIDSPGIYSSGFSCMKHRAWFKNVARFQHLDEMARRIKRLETLQQQEDDYDDNE